MKKLLILSTILCLFACKEGGEKANEGVQPTADFTYTIGNDRVVTFFNTSTDGESYLWDFGDGETSESKSPSHQYTVKEIVTVTLTVTNGSYKDVATQQVDLRKVGKQPTAAFDFAVTGGRRVVFTDQSTDAESWLWTFGDGGTSTDKSPEHTYASADEVTVTLKVTNGELTDEISKKVDPTAVGMAIDGFFDDWADVAGVTPPGDATEQYLKRLKMTSNGENVYFYIEIVKDNDYSNMNICFRLSNTENAMTNAQFFNTPLDAISQFEYINSVAYTPTDPKIMTFNSPVTWWTGFVDGAANSGLWTVSNMMSVDDTTSAFEIAMKLSLLPEGYIPTSSFGVGLTNQSTSSWIFTGYLPANASGKLYTYNLTTKTLTLE
jgi:PKD repeat protein